ncbi:phospholipase D-like domain-containing protein [Lysobacter antibioticus]|uniref:Phospholipase D family protein n=1 Tax=Lysobacter antibioticus TaxID=84531 RepID=A0A0S2FD82_LYSAN|nr:phospholipase D-like domain-containing protein [Lysobacter antibioticus]ALN81482.1 phospholipase D family protein [Lysobacter antibioticus]
MSERWTRKQVVSAIVATVLITVLLGWLAVNLAGPEKRLQRKPEHRYAVTDPQFRQEMGVMLGPALLSGNHVVDLQNGDEIFPAMLKSIGTAQRTITFETYIYWSGEIGKQFSAALSERARAGVRVHVTIDWLGSSKMDSALLAQMQQAGVRVQRYRPIAWHSLDRINNRTHRKILVVDGATAFTGGVGVADQWLGHAQDPEHWRESHFMVRGPVAAQMQAAFSDNWIKTTGQVLNGAAYYPPLRPVGNMDAQMFLSSPAGGSDSMHLMYLMAIAAASQSIDLAAAYFVPDELILQALMTARHRGVRIRILVPGKHTDSDAVRLASKAGWEPLLLSGVEFYEYEPTMMHVKALIVDRHLVSVGSTNFDMRSLRLNDEASLNIYDSGFAERMTTVFEADLTQATPYTLAHWQDRPWTERFAEKFILPLKSQL